MRTGCSVEQREVVAIVFEDVASAITFPCHVVKKTIESRLYQKTEDFLSPMATVKNQYVEAHTLPRRKVAPFGLTG